MPLYHPNGVIQSQVAPPYHIEEEKRAFRRERGPPERLLRAFRRLCRVQNVNQPDCIPGDPVLWRQEGANLVRGRTGLKNVSKIRAGMRVGK